MSKNQEYNLKEEDALESINNSNKQQKPYFFHLKKEGELILTLYNPTPLKDGVFYFQLFYL